MYSAGYMHRDLSVGNILWCADGRGRITDLEYARQFEISCDVSGENQPKTRIADGWLKEDTTVRLRSIPFAKALTENRLGNAGLYGGRITRKLASI